MAHYINGNSMRCYQCAYYKADPDRVQGKWWDGFCYNKEHCRTHKARYPAKVKGEAFCCFDAELPDEDQIKMEDVKNGQRL